MHSDHLKNIFDPIERDKQLEKIRPQLVVADGVYPFDGFLGTGVSGHMASILSFSCDKGLAILRSGRDPSHSSLNLEYSLGVQKVVIVDDLVNTGETLRRLMKKACDNGLDVEGIVLYNENYGRGMTDLSTWAYMGRGFGHNIGFLIDSEGKLLK